MTQDDADNVERLIDEVAREMTAAPARGGLARRVVDRIDDAPPAGTVTPLWRRPWVLVPAAAGVLVVAVVLVRDGNVRLKPDATGNTTTEVTRPDAAAETESGRRAESTGLSDVQPSALSPQPLSPQPLSPQPLSPQPLSPQPLIRPGAAAEPSADLATIAPIDVARIDVSPLLTETPIEISAIAIDRIEIAPMP